MYKIRNLETNILHNETSGPGETEGKTGVGKEICLKVTPVKEILSSQELVKTGRLAAMGQVGGTVVRWEGHESWRQMELQSDVGPPWVSLAMVLHPTEL